MADKDSRVGVIIPAAGAGSRLGEARPKALVEISGHPLIWHTVDRFRSITSIVEILVVVPMGCCSEFSVALTALQVPGRSLRFVEGGATRQESVAIGLGSLSSAPDIVCVHDAARPLVAESTIRQVIAEAAEGGAATAARRPVDSIRQDLSEGGTRALDRGAMWLVETPQAFARELLAAVHGRARERGVTATDDATLAEVLMGATVRIVASEAPNPKITSPADLRWIRYELT